MKFSPVVHNSGMILFTLLIWISVTGCSREEPVAAEPAAASEPAASTEPEAFPITATDVVVAEEEIPEVSMQKRVEADFNQDNLDDVAVVEETAAGKSTVSIYLQKKGTDPMKRAYYKAGGIRLTGEFKITALMSTSKTEYTDLVVMQLYTDGHKEMVHFRTMGTDFREVERVVLN